jgi:hypothetical protein
MRRWALAICSLSKEKHKEADAILNQRAEQTDLPRAFHGGWLVLRLPRQRPAVHFAALNLPRHWPNACGHVHYWKQIDETNSQQTLQRDRNSRIGIK